MNLFYFKSDIGNFGDDLNVCMWQKLLGDFNDYPSGIDFIGIGSILDKRILDNNSTRKVVFGSGVRDYNFNYTKEDNLDIRFVRGPISSKVTNNSKYITDAAYCLKLFDSNLNTKKNYKVSYIPYFRNYYNFDWKIFEKYLGIHVINPTDKVERVIDEIKASQFILSSAMHGAIIADMYRIPWMRVSFNQMGRESALTSDLKWKDWIGSVNLKAIPNHSFDFNLNKKENKISELIKLVKFYNKFKSNNYINSSDSILDEIKEKLQEEVHLFKLAYKR